MNVPSSSLRYAHWLKYRFPYSNAHEHTTHDGRNLLHDDIQPRYRFRTETCCVIAPLPVISADTDNRGDLVLCSKG